MFHYLSIVVLWIFGLHMRKCRHLVYQKSSIVEKGLNRILHSKHLVIFFKMISNFDQYSISFFIITACVITLNIN